MMRCLLAVECCHFSAGAEAMAQAIVEAGFPLIAVGPHAQGCVCDGERPDSISLINERAGRRVYRVDGNPVQNVQVAIGMGLVEGPCVFVSHFEPESWDSESLRAELSIDACLEAARMGFPAIAILSARGSSCWSTDDHPMAFHRWYATVIGDLLAFMAASPPPVRSVLVAFVPDDLCHREVRLCASGGVIGGGRISMTALAIEDGADSVARLDSWADLAVSTINSRVGAGSSACVAGCCG